MDLSMTGYEIAAAKSPSLTDRNECLEFELMVFRLRIDFDNILVELRFAFSPRKLR
jgi:hypothetical protein